MFTYIILLAFQVALVVKNPPPNAGDSRDQVRSLGQEDSLEKEMATHSNILAWKIQRQRSLTGYSPQGLNESDMNEVTYKKKSERLLLNHDAGILGPQRRRIQSWARDEA